MICDKCGCDTKVIATRIRPQSGFLYRRRQCTECKERSSTVEVPQILYENLTEDRKGFNSIMKELSRFLEKDGKDGN